MWLRDAPSLFAFPAVLTLHTIGMAILAGINGAIDLRILGIAPDIPLQELRRLVPVMWMGFWMNALTGILLVIAYPTKALTNPMFYVKLGLIALALLVWRGIGRRAFRQDASADSFVDSRLKTFAASSLLCWVAAIVAGRLLAYTYSRLTTI